MPEGSIRGGEPRLRREPLHQHSRRRGQAGLGALALRIGLRAAIRAVEHRQRRAAAAARPAGVTETGHAHVSAAQQMNRAAGMLAVSVLLDSAVEHYRGSFHNRAMYAPLISATLALAASGHGSGDRRNRAHPLRDSIYGLALSIGIGGTCFHLYNVSKRPGGFSWLNLFYGAPLGAPAALSIAGILGLTAERVRDNPDARRPDVLGFPAGRAMAAVTAAGLMGTVAEVGLLHFRGAYHNPAMFLPVIVPPITAAVLAEAALGPRRKRPVARWWMHLTAWLGLAGMAFHACGVARNMGGWRNWSQNVLNGPPLPAPPSFTALSIAGLGALDLLENSRDA
jgi:hypothetical protein